MHLHLKMFYQIRGKNKTQLDFYKNKKKKTAFVILLNSYWLLTTPTQMLHADFYVPLQLGALARNTGN